MSEQQMQADMADAEALAKDLDRAAKTGSQEMVERVGKLLRQAESLPEGSHERDAFMQRALTLSQAYTIDLAIARATQTKKERVEEVEERNFKVSDYGRTRLNANTKHFTELMMAICQANDIEYLLSSNGVWVFARGFPSDLDMAERLFAILSVEMVTSADAALKRGDHKVKRWVDVTQRVEIPEEERAWGEEVPDEYGHRYAEDESEVGLQDTNWDVYPAREYTLKAPPTHRTVPVLDAWGHQKREERVVSSVDGRIWRANFYQSFVQGIRTRLRKAKAQALKDAGIDMADESDSGALVLRDKKKEVKDAHEKYVLENYGGEEKMRTFKGAEVNHYDHTAQIKGKDAAERARLGDEKDVSGHGKGEIGR